MNVRAIGLLSIIGYLAIVAGFAPVSLSGS
jgi:hypothetical protein